MKMRFEVGELAKVVVSTNPAAVGMVVSILAVGPFKQYDMIRIPHRLLMIANDADYAVDTALGAKLAFDYQLAKLNDPDEPLSAVKAEEQSV